MRVPFITSPLDRDKGLTVVRGINSENYILFVKNENDEQVVLNLKRELAKWNFIVIRFDGKEISCVNFSLEGNYRSDNKSFPEKSIIKHS
jgi:hypothetical protein